jgi:hypothetical protein
VVVTDPLAGDAAAGAATGPSSRSSRTTHPSPTRPAAKEAGTAAEATSPDPNWFDASGLGGFLGVGTDSTPVPAEAAVGDPVPADLESALADRDHVSSPSSAALLGVSLVILLALLVGVAVRWWDRRPGRYWPA